MRPKVDWMTRSDEYILETLDDTNLILGPAIFAINFDYSANYISGRCRKLQRAGLLDRIERGYYEISDKGRAYLAGELDAEDLPDPDANSDDC